MQAPDSSSPKLERTLGPVMLWGLGVGHQDDAIRQMDLAVLRLGEFIKSPKSTLINYTLKFIGKFEEKNVGAVIRKLREE